MSVQENSQFAEEIIDPPTTKPAEAPKIDDDKILGSLSLATANLKDWVWYCGIYVFELMLDSGRYSFKALILLRKPLAFIIAFLASSLLVWYLFIFMLSYVVSWVVSWISKPYNIVHVAWPGLFSFPVFAHACGFPILASLYICQNETRRGGMDTLKGLTALQEYTFTNLSSNILTDPDISFEISRMSITRLPELVSMLQESDLPGRFAIIEAFEAVIEKGDNTSASLQRFSATVQGSLDAVIGAGRASISRLNHSPSLSWPWLTSQKGARLLWNAIVVFEEEIDAINDAFNIAKLDLERLRSLLHAALTITRQELRLETQDRDAIWKSLWTYLGYNRDHLIRAEENIRNLGICLQLGKQGVDVVHNASYVISAASQGFKNIKRQFKSNLNINDPLVLQLHYQIITESIMRLSDVRSTGFGKGK